jgi:phage virion morphogenesis protein
MNGVEAIQVDSSRVQVALGKFKLSLMQRDQLLDEIGAAQLVSVRRTFREQGSPAGSWVPLSPNTIKRDPKRYGAGHKLLVLSGRLLNSITFGRSGTGVVIGTKLVYAPVHQFGSRDRSTAIGPQTEAESQTTVKVKASSYYRRSAELGVGRQHGRRTRIAGPRNARQVSVGARTRHQNIPPRPYLVFRPEDPARIRGIVVRFADAAKKNAGLGGAG